MTGKGYSKTELEMLTSLDKMVRSKGAGNVLDAIARELDAELKDCKEEILIWRPVIINHFGSELPEGIRSVWVFGVQAKKRTGAERHPRSHQRMMSFWGTGDLEVWDGKRWISRALVSELSEKIGKRWISIPPHTWHQALAGERNWIVVSFHTVCEDELVEERPDPDDPMVTHSRRYLA
jgi:hypothetical protein